MKEKEIVEMNDREILTDSLFSQIFLAEQYNRSISQVVSPKIRDEMMSLLSEEHQIQSEIFDEMMKRGFSSSQQVEKEIIQEAKQRYTDYLKEM